MSFASRPPGPEVSAPWPEPWPCLRSRSSVFGQGQSVLTARVPPPTVAPHLDKGTPGESRAPKLRVLASSGGPTADATKAPTTAELPKLKPAPLGGARSLPKFEEARFYRDSYCTTHD
jgi:hypothetical protein